MRRDSLALLATLGFFALGAFAACGSDDDTPPPAAKTVKPKPTTTGTGTGTGTGTTPTASGPPTTLLAFAQQYAPAYCAAATPCCKSKGSTTDQAGCEKALYQQFTLIQDSATYDKTLGKDCIDNLQVLAEDSDACSILEKGLSECLKAVTLQAATTGTVAPGGACTSSEECAPPPQGDARCEEVGLEPKKICQHVLGGADGATPCVGDARQTLVVNEDPKLSVGTVYRCNEGLQCDSSSRVCKAAGAIGSSCFASFECTSSAYCAGGKCVAALADGAKCASDDECSSKSFCSSKQSCAAYVAPGGACTSDPDSRCADGACVNGKCAEPDPGAGSQLTCF